MNDDEPSKRGGKLAHSIVFLLDDDVLGISASTPIKADSFRTFRMNE
jgi:hypothetical protein